MPFKPQSWSPYESLPLPQAHVPSLRIFRIVPGDPGEALHGELSVESMRSLAGKYSALSYTWGTATEQRWIVINGKPFHIQPSLYAALHAMRSPVEDLLLWVDAICINQNDTKERNHQVGMMGQIYYNAKDVLAFLGPAADDSDLLFDQLNAGKFDTSDYSIAQSKAEQALSEICLRGYWERAWTIQEIALANEVTFYCGSKSIKGPLFFVWALLCQPDFPIRKNRIMVYIGHRSRAKDGRFLNLEQLILDIGKPGCEDLRDRIFAVVSLAVDCIGKEDQIVDYRLNLPMLFFGLIAFCKPKEPSTFAAVLQDILYVTSRDLIDQANKFALSNMEEDKRNGLIGSFIQNAATTILGNAVISEDPLPEREAVSLFRQLTPFKGTKKPSDFLNKAFVSLIWSNIGGQMLDPVLFPPEYSLYFIGGTPKGLVFRRSLAGSIYDGMALLTDKGWKRHEPKKLFEITGSNKDSRYGPVLFAIRILSPELDSSTRAGVRKGAAESPKGPAREYAKQHVDSVVAIIAELTAYVDPLCLVSIRMVVEGFCCIFEKI